MSLRDVIANIIHKPFAFLKTKVRLATGTEKREEFWALKDVNFTVQAGEVVGIIGANGAGKSTLLKVLSQITPPTEGEINIHGRVGSLLEVGTGFHPELTGRENIFLNGAILGMKRAEIAERFDKIVAFAGIEKFLDTPVKHYSSGMYVRLAFSVAAHMEPDVLIVDEVLAVGDSEFQKKCLGKMSEIRSKEHRTILFVSHNMNAIRQICNRAILLEKGRIIDIGEVNKVVDKYIGDTNSETAPTSAPSIEFSPDTSVKKDIEIKKINLRLSDETKDTTVYFEKSFEIDVTFEVKQPSRGVFISIGLTDINGQNVAEFIEDEATTDRPTLEPGTYVTRVKIPGMFNAGVYDVSASIENGTGTFDKKSGLRIHIIDDQARSLNLQKRASVLPKTNWYTKKI